ncbi:MAG: DUF465 domain-containing protein [Deltaproteobacteria bacterium]
MAKENNDEIVKRLLQEDSDFRRKHDEHRDCERDLKKMEKKPRLSASEALDKKKIKKIKLALKDEMQAIIARQK